MEPLVGRTVSQIKNRYYQNLKGKDLDKIKYIADDEPISPKANSVTTSLLECNEVQQESDKEGTIENRKRDIKLKEKEK